jgi:hypothetical protein
MIRDAIAFAEILRAAGPPQGEYAVIAVSAARAEAAARLKSAGFLEIRAGAPATTQLAVRLTALGLGLRTKLQRSRVMGPQVLRSVPLGQVQQAHVGGSVSPKSSAVRE